MTDHHIAALDPEPVSLEYLSDRARAYVIGLESRLKQRGQEVDELRAKLNDPSMRDEKAVRKAYRQGWGDCAAKLAETAQAAARSLSSYHAASMAAYLAPDSEDGAATGIVSAAHYCQCATLGLVCGHHYGGMA